jgi:choline dehydrogenase-like flavoprotein
MSRDGNQLDFDFIIVGSGFGGSVSALRLVEKGYRVAVIEMGRRWTAENLPKTSWQMHRWFWRPEDRIVRLFQHALLPACNHTARLRRGRRVDHVRVHDAEASGQSVGQQLVGQAGGLETGDASALRRSVEDAGGDDQQDSWAGRQAAAQSS